MNKIELFNLALSRLGGEQLPFVNTEYENNTTAQLCRSIYPHALNLALSVADWQFATRRIAPALLPDVEFYPKGLPFSFQFPPDLVRIITVKSLNANPFFYKIPYKIGEKQTFFAAENQVLLTYITNDLTVEDLPILFLDALSWKIAKEIAILRLNDEQKEKTCEIMYLKTITEAKAAASNAQKDFQPIKSNWTVR